MEIRGQCPHCGAALTTAFPDDGVTVTVGAPGAEPGAHANGGVTFGSLRTAPGSDAPASDALAPWPPGSGPIADE